MTEPLNGITEELMQTVLALVARGLRLIPLDHEVLRHNVQNFTELLVQVGDRHHPVPVVDGAGVPCDVEAGHDEVEGLDRLEKKPTGK